MTLSSQLCFETKGIGDGIAVDIFSDFQYAIKRFKLEVVTIIYFKLLDQVMFIKLILLVFYSILCFAVTTTTTNKVLWYFSFLLSLMKKMTNCRRYSFLIVAS